MSDASDTPVSDEPPETDEGEPERFYAPNQQVVRADGSGPAEEGNGGSAPPEPQPEPHDDDTAIEDE